jgi:orotidine-5'-phosphate decarboxylase
VEAGTLQRQDPAAVSGFGDTITALVSRRESQLVLGIDPDPSAPWPGVGRHEQADVGGATPAEGAAAGVLAGCRALIDAAAPACVAVKFQLACFERLQAPGWSALQALVGHAREHGLLVIADGKRGDVPVSALAYAQALFDGVQTRAGFVHGLGADLATINPLIGGDAVAPFVAAARGRGSGVFALVRTSNPGASDVEDLVMADGRPLWERLARMVAETGADGVGESGLSDVGAVMGATAPALLVRARELMPHAVFLLPGVGAQGGRVQELAGAFAPLQAPARRASALVSASRSIAEAHKATGRDPVTAARAEAEQLRTATWEASG